MGGKAYNSTTAPLGADVYGSAFEAATAWLAKTHIVEALVSAVLILAVLAALNYLADYALNAAFDFSLGILPIGVLVSLAVLSAAGPLAFGRVRASWAYMEAAAERVTGRDLNGSGAIADVAAPERVRETVFVQTKNPQLSDVIPVTMVDGATVDVLKADLRAVIEDGNLIRERWLGKNDAAPLPPFSEQDDARSYYDAIMYLLDEKLRLVKRGANNARVLLHSPADTLAALKLG